MFNNIGSKIKGWAVFCCILGMVASVIGAVVIWVSRMGFFYGLSILVFGCLGSWMGTWVLYAIGDTNEKVTFLISRGAYGYPVDKPSAKKVIAQGKEAIREPEKHSNGNWICVCGRENQHVVSSCACGRSKWEVFAPAATEDNKE